jgi:hypothetical protein
LYLDNNFNFRNQVKMHSRTSIISETVKSVRCHPRKILDIIYVHCSATSEVKTVVKGRRKQWVGRELREGEGRKNRGKSNGKA